MAFSYRWSDLITLVSKQVKNIPTQQIDVFHCDLVSGEMAQRLPWKFVQQTIADGQIPLIDWVQDYDPPFNIWRLTAAWLTCTSTNPNDDVSLTVKDSNAPDQFRRSPYAITSVSLEGGVGKLRLSSAVIVPENQTWELRGIYQINPTKVISTSQVCWFDDRYVNVAVEGLTYWYYKLADDPRAGSTSTSLQGPPAFSGQLAQFMGAIQKMAISEDQGGDMQAMPDAPLGLTAGQYGHIVAAFGFGGGAGTNEQSRGVVAVNNDTSPTQFLVGGAGISITSMGVGGHLISMLGDGGQIVAGIQSINLSTAPSHSIVAGAGISVATDALTGITTITNTGGGGVGPGPAPTITSVSPNSGPATGGTSVTITGTNFSPGATVMFGSSFAANVVVVSATTITATAPAGTAGAVTVTVNVAGQPGSLANAFTYIPVPTVTSVSPNTGPANTTTAVTITGTNFAAGATVTFGGIAATSVVVVNATSITCTAPSRAAGAVPVAVTVSGQTGTLNNAFTYVAPAQPIYSGLGATTGVACGVGCTATLSGTTVTLATGDTLAQVQTTPETVGQTFPFTNLNNQVIYLLLRGGSHTSFLDQNNNVFAMNSPITVTLSGATMYLYVSSNPLYGNWTVKINN